MKFDMDSDAFLRKGENHNNNNNKNHKFQEIKTKNNIVNAT